MHGRVISARMHDCRLLSRRTPQLQHLGGVVQWQRCTMVELRDDSTTAQHQDHGLRLLRCTRITSSTQCTEVRALNLCATRRLGARDPIQDSDTKDLKNLTENYAYSSRSTAVLLYR